MHKTPESSEPSVRFESQWPVDQVQFRADGFSAILDSARSTLALAFEFGLTITDGELDFSQIAEDEGQIMVSIHTTLRVLGAVDATLRADDAPSYFDVVVNEAWAEYEFNVGSQQASES